MSITASPITPKYEEQILFLGCGKGGQPGCLNVDCRALPGVDLILNLNRHPWPFPDESWKKIVAYHVFEHLLDVPAALQEIARILKPGGICELKVPHMAGWGAWNDPTHRNYFTKRSFQYFKRGEYWNYYFDFSFTDVKAKNRFGIGRSSCLNWIMNPIVNTVLYDYFLWKIIPCAEIEVKLVK